MAITRNASESNEIVQYGIDLKPGDEVLTTDQDYPRMLMTFRQRERRDGIKSNAISFPVPVTSADDLHNRIERAVTPKTKLILICHITNRTGVIFPVRRIADMAHAAGIPLMVDGAHAFNHFPFKISDLNCDYYGCSLHKWTCAPGRHGIPLCEEVAHRPDLVLMASDAKQAGDIRKFEEIGTHPAANPNSISEALVFNENIGIPEKPRGCAICATGGRIACGKIPRSRSFTARARSCPAASALSASTALTRARCTMRSSPNTTSSPRACSMRSMTACALPRTSTRPCATWTHSRTRWKKNWRRRRSGQKPRTVW